MKHSERTYQNYYKDTVTKRRAILQRYKQMKGCADCGYNKDGCAMDFDHVDPKSKLFGVATDLRRAWEKTKTEVRKCIVLCANCHRVRTHRGQIAWEAT